METASAFSTSNTLRVTIPKSVRRALHINPRDILLFTLTNDGCALIENLSQQRREKPRRGTR